MLTKTIAAIPEKGFIQRYQLTINESWRQKHRFLSTEQLEQLKTRSAKEYRDWEILRIEEILTERREHKIAA